MSKPSIGAAVTPALKDEINQKKKIKELTVLEYNSKESIYNLIFSDTKDGS